MENYEQLLIEEQFMSRLKQTLLATWKYYDEVLKVNKYDVEANKKQPIVKKDIQVIERILSNLSAKIILEVEKKHGITLHSITINRPGDETKIDQKSTLKVS